MKRLLMAGAVFLVVTLGSAQTPKARKTDTEIKQQIINESLSHYRGNCPCPYNTDRGGRRCGARSAYSRPGGASPLCYAADVTPKMVDEYRKKNGQN
jgi:choline dehydrogenase-like flavoprotein